jgi:hypothetical protein
MKGTSVENILDINAKNVRALFGERFNRWK